MSNQEDASVEDQLAATFDRIAALRERLAQWDTDAALPPEPTLTSEPEPEPELAAAPQPTGDAEIEPEPEPAAEAEHEAEAEAEPETEPEPEIETEPEADIETEPEPDIETDIETEPEPDIETDIEAETHVEPETGDDAPIEALAEEEGVLADADSRDDAEAAAAAERHAQALQDIAELDRQVAAGEIDPERAGALRSAYTAEAAAALKDAGGSAAGEAAPPRFRRRTIAAAAVLVAAVAIAAFAVTQAVRDRDPDSPLTGGFGTEIEDMNLEGVTDDELEQIVADNPEVVDVRLALARRYVEAGEFQLALPHYLTVLQAGDNVEAYAYLGYMAYLSGEPQEGADLVEQGTAIDPEDPLALAILAVIRLDGLGDSTGALEILDRLAANPHLPDELRDSVEDMRNRAAAAS